MPPIEFYTYGGFDSTVSGLTRLALIMSDVHFKEGAGVFAIIGGAFAGYQLYNGKDGWGPLLHWFMGVILFVGIVADASTTLQVYDPVKNKSQAVGGLPIAVAVSLGVMSAVEKGFIDMISTSGDPLGYQQSAGGVGLNLIYQAATVNLNVPDQYMEMNLHQYIGDCFGFMYDTGTDIDLNAIMSNNTDLLAELAKGSTGSMWLENWYTATDHSGGNGGTIMYCDAAWTQLSATYAAGGTAYKGMVNSVCGAGGAYDPTDPAQLASCQSTMDGWVSMMVTGNSAGGPTGADFIRQSYLARQLAIGVAQMDPNYKSSQDFVATSAGGASFAQNWGPQMRAGMFMIALMITPFLLLFMATPMWSTVLPFVIGLYMLPTVWGICDASLNEAVISLSNQIFQEVKANKMGLNALAFAETDSMKLLTYLNYARAAGLGLATMIISALFKWGAGAASWGGEASRTIQSVGGAAGAATLTPQGAASTLENDVIRPSATMANWDRNGSDAMIQSAAHDAMAKTGGNKRAAEHSGGWRPYTENSEFAAAASATDRNAAAGKMTLDEHEGHGKVTGGREKGMVGGFAEAGAQTGVSADKASENTSNWKTKDAVFGANADKEGAQQIAKNNGISETDAQQKEAQIKAAKPVGEAQRLIDNAGVDGAAALVERQAEMDTGKKSADLTRVDDLSKALGYKPGEGMQRAQTMEATGGMLEKAEMASLNGQGFHLSPGMKMAEGVKHTAYDDKGNLVGMKVGGSLSGDQVTAAAKEARAQGLTNTANELDRMAKAGKSVEVNGNAGVNGWTSMKFGSGAEASQFDKAMKQDIVSQEKSRSKKDVNEDVKQRNYDHQSKNTGGQNFENLDNRLLTGGEAAASAFIPFKGAEGQANRKALVTAQAGQWAKEAGAFADQKGVNYDESSGQLSVAVTADQKASVKVATPGIIQSIFGVEAKAEASAGLQEKANASVSIGSKDAKSYNLMAQKYEKTANDAYDAEYKKSSNHYNSVDAMQHATEKLTSEFHKGVNDMTHFGAAAVPGRLADGAKAAGGAALEGAEATARAALEGANAVNKATGGSGNFSPAANNALGMGAPDQRDYDRFGRPIEPKPELSEPRPK